MLTLKKRHTSNGVVTTSGWASRPESPSKWRLGYPSMCFFEKVVTVFVFYIVALRPAGRPMRRKTLWMLPFKWFG